MRKLLLLLLLPQFVLAQSGDKEVDERVSYFKSHPIFVTQFTLDPKKVKKLNESQLEKAKMEFEELNKNLRIAFTTFWNINDTIIFIPDNQLKVKQKEFKGGIFFVMMKMGESTNDNGETTPVTAFKLIRPNKADYFNNVMFRPAVDGSLVNIITQLRQLMLNVTTGDVINKKDLGPKIILINKDEHEQLNTLGKDLVNLIRAKYKGNYIEVDNGFIQEALIRKHPKYIYTNNGSAYNVEDGTMVPIY